MENIEELRDFIPVCRENLGLDILKEHVLGAAFMVQLDIAVRSYLDGSWSACHQVCKLLLDITWEHLNTGHWKDVDITWRHAYSCVSLMKAISEFALNKNDSAISIIDSIKTCDMGLLMGAPILGNVLTRLVSKLQHLQRMEVQAEHPSSTIVSCTRASDHELREVSSGLTITTSEQDQKSCPLQCGQDKKRNLESHEKGALDKKKKHKQNVLPAISPSCAIKIEHCPSLEKFQNQYMKTKTPVIICDAVDYWPAFSTRPWSLDYIKSVAGCRTVPIELGSKYTEESWSQTLMTVGEFIEKYIEHKHGDTGVGYLAQHQLFDQVPELQNDISVPTYCCLTDQSLDKDGIPDEDVDINAWFGPEGTISPLHHDPKHNLLTQVVGEKYIRLYAEEHSAAVYPNEDGILSNTSQVDVEQPDLEKFPLFAKAPYTECVLRPGEMLYIPPRHWHYVRSLSVSFSVSFWWQ